MRLTDAQRNVLKAAARQSFEPGVVVRLFGSRLDDSRLGGDIDLLIETHMTDPAQIVQAHTQFLAQIYTCLGEQKVDVLIDYPNRQIQSAIYTHAHETGVEL